MTRLVSCAGAATDSIDMHKWISLAAVHRHIFEPMERMELQSQQSNGRVKVFVDLKRCNVRYSNPRPARGNLRGQQRGGGKGWKGGHN